MTWLTNQQKELLFDYCLGLTSEKETAEAELLISSEKNASEIHSKLKAAITPLDSLQAESCPDELAEGTVYRLINAARSNHLQLEQLLAAEQTKGVTAKSRFWRSFGEVLATAAVIVFVSGIVFAPLRYARQSYWRQLCASQLAQIARGVERYKSDHDGQMPSVATSKGEPWWKVGCMGKENHSNTRHLWLLAKGGYVDTTNFVCPGKREGTAIQFDSAEAEKYNDFPARRYVTYSLRIRCNKSRKNNPYGRKALLADLNPLFENFPRDYSEQPRLKLDVKLLNLNSVNHSRKGQNVLFCDGSVVFTTTRHTDISKDDIFTLQDIMLYQGTEVPSCEADAFLAP
ncbi:MAG: hypothetical protein ACYSSL_07560 [Planctomycetota bacterium]